VRIVLDTNVLVSALWKPQGPPGVLVRGLADGRLQPVLSPVILAEYHEVLARRRFNFDQKRVSQILSFIQLIGVVVQGASSGRRLPDTTDLPFLDAALEAGAAYIVTGNFKDFPAEECVPVKPVGPAKFLARWTGSQA
jgi:putative PIN family toxin of toxin-antitoxin system